jgi:serine/threonine protein kinase
MEEVIICQVGKMSLPVEYESAEILARRPLGLIMRLTLPDAALPVIARAFMPPATLPEEFTSAMIDTMEKEASTLQSLARHSFSDGALMEERAVVSPTDIIRLPDALLIHFPYADLPSLSQFIRSRAPFTPRASLNILKQISDISNLLLEKDIHRFQLEPDFIFVLEDETRIFYIDAALVNLVKFPEIISFGYLDGCPQLLPPELLCGHELVSASHVYPLGILTYYLLTGTLPLAGQPLIATAVRSLSEKLPPLKRFQPQAAARLDTLLGRATDKNPARRISSLKEFMDELNAALSPENSE